MLSLATLLVVAFTFFTAITWDGHQEFTLTLSEATTADTSALFYESQASLEMAQRTCESYRNEKYQDIEQMFVPVSVKPDGSFTVIVPIHGTTWLWGLWRERGMHEYVILMSKKPTGQRAFKCVSVKTTEAISLK